jgi:hypothetical protein
MAMRAALAALLVAVSSSAVAAPLTIRAGETWEFALRNGDPVGARKVAATSKVPKGRIKASVRRLMGTSMVLTNNSGAAYTFRAELLKAGKTVAAKPCVLPAKPDPAFEQWPQAADAVRIGTFKTAPKDGSCP